MHPTLFGGFQGRCPMLGNDISMVIVMPTTFGGRVSSDAIDSHNASRKEIKSLQPLHPIRGYCWRQLWQRKRTIIGAIFTFLMVIPYGSPPMNERISFIGRKCCIGLKTQNHSSNKEIFGG
jgi:hypothetical protein